MGGEGSVSAWVRGWCGSKFGVDDMGSVGPQNFGVSGMGKENGKRKCLAI